jgi:hypothetical protein
MSTGHRYEAEWVGLRLVIEQRPNHFQAFVYDPGECEVLYRSADECRWGHLAVEFAASTRFGPQHDLKSEVIASMLMWEPV